MKFIFELLGLSFEEFTDWEIRWGPDEVGWILAVVIFLVPAALVFFWTSLARIRSRYKKAFLFSLRVLTFILLMLVLFRPELEFNKSRLLKNTIAVLLDDSKSLSIKTFPEEKPRLDIVRRVLQNNRDYFEKLKEDYQVDFYFVSDQVTPVSWTDIDARYRAQGINTDLNGALRDIKKRYEGKSLQGVMLFSDGADLGEEPTEVSPDISKTLAFFGTPIHTFQAGTNENFKDLGIEKLDAPDFGFIHQEVNLSVDIIASSMGNKNIPLVIKEGERVLVSKTLEIREGQTRYKIHLQFVPGEVGKKNYTLSLPLFAGESIAINNRKEFQIKVIRDRIRVLLLNGRPSWDARFLREVLINNPKVDLLSFFILRTLNDDVQASMSEVSLIPFPSNLLFTDYLSSFDLVIFQNFKYAPFIDEKYLQNIKKYVHKGGAFIMIGGDLSFQGGGYDRTPVEDILPVRIQKKSGLFLHDEFAAHVDKKLIHHPILHLEKNKDLNYEAWATMPKLNGLNIGLEPVEDAQVLVSYKKDKDQTASHPILALRKSGSGRVLILATDSSWNWNFRRVGQGGSGRYYQHFWNNIIAWMMDEPETHLIKIETDKEKYQEKEQVLIKIKILGDDYNPVPNTEIDLVLHSISKKQELSRHKLKTDKLGVADFEFIPRSEGFYSARVHRTDKEQDSGKEVRFSVAAQNAEFEKPLINSLLLQTMAQVTAGMYRILDEQADLTEHQFPSPKIRAKTKTKTISLWDSWWSYAMIVGFLLVDWWMRRKSGLS